MDGLDWTKFQPEELEESLMMPTSRAEMVPGGDNFLSPSSQYIEKIDNLLTPWSSIYYWGSSPPPINDARILDFGQTSSTSHPGQPAGAMLDPDPTRKLAPVMAQTTDSLESIDCSLFSASNQTEANASAEDDDMSLIFSNPKPLSKAREAKPARPPTAESRCKRKRPESSPANLDFIRPVNPADNDSNHHGPRPKRAQPEKHPTPSHINFQRASSSAGSSSADEPDPEAIAQLKEIIYRTAAFRPVNFGPETAERPKRRNVRISSDPQTVAARERRERISERIRVLQRLVPGGSKMDTASMLDEAANYLRFLRSQVKALEAFGRTFDRTPGFNFPVNDGNLAFLNYSFAMQQRPPFSIHDPKSI